MPISIRCPGCNTEYPVPDDLAGTVVNCRDCKTIIFVPEPPPIPLQESPPEPEVPEPSYCPACHNISTVIDNTCMTCGFNQLTGKSLNLPTIDLAEQFHAGARRRSFNYLFRRFDRLIIACMAALFLASVIAWIAYAGWQRGLFSFHERTLASAAVTTRGAAAEPAITQAAVATTAPEEDPFPDNLPPEVKTLTTDPSVPRRPTVETPRIVQVPPIRVTIPPRNVVKPPSPAVAATAKAPYTVITPADGVAEILAYPDLQNVQNVIVNDISSEYFLVVKKSSDGEVMVERWSGETMEKTGEVSFEELPQEPIDYAVSPSGNMLVSLSRFPTNELQISGFDKESAPRKILMDERGVLGTPRLVGFIDATHFIIRWGGRLGVLQMWTTNGRAIGMTKSPAMDDDFNQWALSPNPARGGTKLAALLPGDNNYSQVYVGMIEGWTLVQRFTPRNALFDAAGMAFSDDANNLGICSLTSDGGSVMIFDLRTDKNRQTIVFPASVYHQKIAHGLVWVQGNDLLLIGGKVLYDAASGKRVGPLGLEGIIDAHNIGPGKLLLLQDAGNGVKNGLVMKVDVTMAGAARGDEKR